MSKLLRKFTVVRSVDKRPMGLLYYEIFFLGKCLVTIFWDDRAGAGHKFARWYE